MKKRLKTLLPDNIKTDVTFRGKQLSFDIKYKTEFPYKHIWFTMLNVLKKVAMKAMLAKRQDASIPLKLFD